MLSTWPPREGVVVFMGNEFFAELSGARESTHGLELPHPHPLCARIEESCPEGSSDHRRSSCLLAEEIK